MPITLDKAQNLKVGDTVTLDASGKVLSVVEVETDTYQKFGKTVVRRLRVSLEGSGIDTFISERPADLAAVSLGGERSAKRSAKKQAKNDSAAQVEPAEAETVTSGKGFLGAIKDFANGPAPEQPPADLGALADAISQPAPESPTGDPTAPENQPAAPGG